MIPFYYIYMKSLVESLFDKDLVTKDLPVIGEKYNLIQIGMPWGTHFNSGGANGYEEDYKLMLEMFNKNKLKNIKPVNIKNIKILHYKSQLNIYYYFRRMVTLLNEIPYNEYNMKDIKWANTYDEELKTLYPYVSKKDTTIKLRKFFNFENNKPLLKFSVVRSLDGIEGYGKGNYIEFNAIFEER